MKASLEEFLSATRALADRHRVRALMALRGGELCVCQLIELLQLAPSTVSKHMSVLKQAGLVDSRKDCRWVYYRLADGAAASPARRTGELAVALLSEDPLIRQDRAELRKISAMNTEAMCKLQRNRVGRR